MLSVMADPRIAQINSLLHQTGKSQRWLATAVSSTVQTVSNVLNGTTKSPRDANIVDRMLSALEELPPSRHKVIAGKQMLRPVPVFSHIMAGPPEGFSINEADEYEMIPEWGFEFERWGRKISGDSMHPVLQAGDIAIFENRRHDNGSVVQAFKDGEDCVKAFRIVGGVAQLHSFNPDGPTLDADGYEAKGVCVMRIRYKKFGIREIAEFPGGLTWAMREEDI